MPSDSDIRRPAVAGVFYPAERHSLGAEVDRLLGAAPPSEALPAVRMLLSPHAGYLYSGAIAARGFHRVRGGASPSRVFVIGPSHVEAFAFTSVYAGSAYRTPLGDVPVDARAARALAEADASIRLSSAGHDVALRGRGEHGIEVQLPFLQRIAPGATIVPIVMGSQSWEACEALGGAIAAIADRERDLVIASSDLSHFYDDRTARSLDGVFCASLMALDARALYDRVARGECEACGAGPVVASLLATASLRNVGCELLATGNSGDVSEDRSSVVGYASAVVTGDLS